MILGNKTLYKNVCYVLFTMGFWPSDKHKVYGSYLIWFRKKCTYEKIKIFKGKTNPIQYFCITDTVLSSFLFQDM